MNSATAGAATTCRFETNNWAQHAQHAAPSNLQKPGLDYRLYAVTDPACNARCQRSNAEAVRQAIQGGVTLVQLREKDAEGGTFIREAEQVMEVAKASGVSLQVLRLLKHCYCCCCCYCCCMNQVSTVVGLL